VDVVTGVGGPYAALAPAMVLEGPVATFVGGTLVGAGHAALVLVWLLAFGTDLVLDSVLYLLGRAGRRAGRHPRAARLTARLGFTAERQDALSRRARDRLGTVVAGAKLVDAGAVPAFLAAGWAGVGYARFLGWTALLTALRVSVLVGLGVLTGEHLAARVEGVLDRPWLAVLGGLALAAVLLGARALAGAALRAVRSGGGLLAASSPV
jgi:membrane protein DedA with SNARE-associated domain